MQRVGRQAPKSGTPGCIDPAKDEFPVPSGYVNSLLWKMTIEIVDVPNKHGDLPVRYVNLPEGKIGLFSHGLCQIVDLSEGASTILYQQMMERGSN